MPKTITLTGTELGTDLTELNIYHTEITGSNLLRAAARRSDLSAGITLYDVPDNATTFWIECTSGKCTGTSGSITIAAYAVGTQYFSFTMVSGSSGYYGQTDTIALTFPSDLAFTATSGTTERSINWTTTTTATVKATAAYPRTFTGWYEEAEGNTIISSGSTLTLTSGSAPDDIFAIFSS